MNNEPDNHMNSREDRPTVAELEAAIRLIDQKQAMLVTVIEGLDDMIAASNKFAFMPKKLEAFLNYLNAEYDDCDTDRRALQDDLYVISKLP